MRILLIHKFHYRLGGAERIYFDTARILQAAGHEVAFFSMQHPQNETTPWSKYFVSEVGYDDSGKGLWEKFRIVLRILWNPEANRKLEAVIREFKPDVAHCFNIFHQLSPSILWMLRKHHIPTVLTLCDFKVVSPNYFLYHFDKKQIWESNSGWRCIRDKCVKNSYAKSLVCAVEKWLHDMLGSYYQVAVFLAPSEFLIEKYHALGFKKPIERIHHPVVRNNQTATLVRPFLERPEEYLYFGRFSVEKGVDTVIRSFTKLPTSMKLLLVGYGPQEEELRTLAKELRLEERVQFLGGIYGEELERIIERVRGVILSSVWYENQPFVMMDTFLSGTLLIASRIGGIPDILHDGINGLLFEPGNADDLARVIRSIPQYDYQKLVTAAQATALVYTDERYLSELLHAYTEARSQEKIPPV